MTWVSWKRLLFEEQWARESHSDAQLSGLYSLMSVLGPKKGQPRTAKQIMKGEDHASTVGYTRELLALAKFSQKKVGILTSP